MSRHIKTALIALKALAVGVNLWALGSGEDGTIIAIDGSSTVFPITEAVAEEFQMKTDARVTIGVSGSGGGFKKFARGEIDISNASRAIKPSEIEACDENGMEFIELPVAFDGIAIVVHPEAEWVDFMTVKELKMIWEPAAQDKILRWNQIRPQWPDEEIHLFGPGIDSGTYDYFTLAIVGEEHSSRGDFTSSEDDNVLVHGISSDKLALGFFGLVYYTENADKLKIVPINDEDDTNGVGAIIPTLKTVAESTYQPLSRPLLLYISAKAAEREEIDEFISFYLTSGRELIKEVGYIPLPNKTYELAAQRFENRRTGSVFSGSKVGVTIEELFQ